MGNDLISFTFFRTFLTYRIEPRGVNHNATRSSRFSLSRIWLAWAYETYSTCRRRRDNSSFVWVHRVIQTRTRIYDEYRTSCKKTTRRAPNFQTRYISPGELSRTEISTTGGSAVREDKRKSRMCKYQRGRKIYKKSK